MHLSLYMALKFQGQEAKEIENLSEFNKNI